MIRWKTEAEITFDPVAVDGVVETEQQALFRVKQVLNRMLAGEAELAHYHILRMPVRCVELD